MRWLRRLRPSRPAHSHRSGGRRLGGGVMELEAGTVGVAGGPGMLPTARAWAQVGTSWLSWARAHAPRARLGSRQRAAYRKPAGSALVAEGGGGGNAPVTSGSRGSGREGRGGGGETTADWCARIIHTTQWIASSRPARAPSGSAPAAGCYPAVTPLLRWDLPAALHLGSSRWSCGRRRVAATAGGRGERKGDEFHYQSFTPHAVVPGKTCAW